MNANRTRRQEALDSARRDPLRPECAHGKHAAEQRVVAEVATVDSHKSATGSGTRDRIETVCEARARNGESQVRVQRQVHTRTRARARHVWRTGSGSHKGVLQSTDSSSSDAHVVTTVE
jgi:hypothetical protein